MSTNTITEVIEGIKKHGPEILEHCVIDNADQYLEKINKEFLNYPRPKNKLDTNNWFMPDNYKNMDIEKYVLMQCKTDEQIERVTIELEEFRQRNLTMLLRQVKYIVDTLRSNNIVWGVGRGSSVASLVLHILGVHKIDPIKYNIPLNEFFK
jgi:DNA polymerase III alpha subunit|tara:strand:- start:1461 stop:1916 length:456 start_codon:yes stop_codon:yes gene_type:complete